MYTGIIQHRGVIAEVRPHGDLLELDLHSPFTDPVSVDQSIAHNGVCLTVISVAPDRYTVQAVPETISRTTIATWQPGEAVNLELCLPVGGRLDGHLVQGHVDTVAKVLAVRDGGDHRRVRFDLPEGSAHLVAEKGSVCLDGIGLTVASAEDRSFEVELIPRTLEVTAAELWRTGSSVNLEFDVIARYLDRRVRLGVDHSRDR